MRFVLGDRSESSVTDFDGHVRVCGTTELEVKGPKRGVGVTISPALPGDPPLSEAFLVPRHRVDFVLVPGQSISVYVIPPDASGAIACWADVALRPEDLPKSQEEYFDEAVERLRRSLTDSATGQPDFERAVERSGLGVWVENLATERRAGLLRPEWIRQVESLPGWRWPESPETALHTFAGREGHTDVPFDHVEAGVHLGAWVALIRRDPSILGDQDRAHLEAIPEWHW